VLSAARLPLAFDPAGLQADVEAFAEDDWVPHFNTGYYEGDWSGIAFRSVGGVAKQLYPNPAADDPYADTANLERAPNVRSALACFACSLLSVRFLRLSAGSAIREHTDYNLGFEDGELRVHIPVTTNSEVEFVLDGQRLDMRPGEAWYLDLNHRHSVANRGTTDRVHLVVDCVVNDWLSRLLGASEAHP
jgi:mannose-6-phosphate isomerase-like protein (cupin superfamily)